MNLYDINSELESVMAEAMSVAEENEGVIPNDLSERIDTLEMQRDEKIANCARYYKNRASEADAVKAEIDRLTKRKRAADRAAEWMKLYLSSVFAVGQKYQDSAVSIGWRKSAETIIENAEILPDNYVKVKIEKSPDKVAIKAAIVSGVDVPGAKVIEKQNIQIR